MPRPAKYTTYRVLAWLEAGNVGTVAQIAADIRSRKTNVHHSLLTLETRGQARSPYRTADGRVWELRPANDCGPLVKVALHRRTALERAWVPCAYETHMEQCT